MGAAGASSASAMPNILFQMLLRGANARRLHQLSRQRRQLLRQGGGRRPGIDLFRVFDCAELGRQHARRDRGGARGRQALRGGDLLHRRHPRPGADQVRPRRTTSTWPRSSRSAGAHMLAHQGHGGLLQAVAAASAGQGAAQEVGLPIHFHTHDTSGIAGGHACWPRSRRASTSSTRRWRRCPALTSQPSLNSLVEALAAHRARHRARPRARSGSIAFYWEAVRAPVRRLRERTCRRRRVRGLPARDAGRPVHQPQASRRGRSAWRRAGTRSRSAYAEVNQLFGDIVKVTPSSKVVGDMALFMVANNLTPADVLDPGARLAFPESVVEMLRGRARPAARRLPAGAAEEGAQGRRADHRAARARCLPPADLDGRAQAEAEKTLGARARATTSSPPTCCIPKVFADFAAHAAQVRPGQRAADAGLLLRPEPPARRSRSRSSGQDAGRPLLADRRDRRRGQVHGLLRAQRPAARSSRCRTASRRHACRARRKAEAGNDRTRSARRCRAWSSTRRGRGRRAGRRPATCCSRSRR